MPDSISPLEPALRVALEALRPYLPNIVLIGGWVPYLHQQYGAYGTWVGRGSFTSEADILLPAELSADSRPSIADALRLAGFRPDARTTAVWAGDIVRGERIEFLVAHTGTARDRGRARAVTGQLGLSAVSLDRLAILERHSIPMALAATHPNSTDLRVRIPMLGAYILQKAATFTQRLAAADAGSRSKAAKDLLYIRDVLAAGSEVANSVRSEIAALARVDREAAGMARTGCQHLRLVVDGSSRLLIGDAARMRYERDAGSSIDAMTAEMEGRLRDAAELLFLPTKERHRDRELGS